MDHRARPGYCIADVCGLGEVQMKMTLHDNPRVDAEKRIKQLYKRLSTIVDYKFSRLSIQGNRMYINPYIKTDKASRIIKELHKQIRETDKILKSF